MLYIIPCGLVLAGCVSGIITPSCLILFHPGRGESGKDGEKSVVQQEEKGFLQKLKDVFWKEEEEDDSKTRQKQKMN